MAALPSFKARPTWAMSRKAEHPHEHHHGAGAWQGHLRRNGPRGECQDRGELRVRPSSRGGNPQPRLVARPDAPEARRRNQGGPVVAQALLLRLLRRLPLQVDEALQAVRGLEAVPLPHRPLLRRGQGSKPRARGLAASLLCLSELHVARRQVPRVQGQENRGRVEAGQLPGEEGRPGRDHAGRRSQCVREAAEDGRVPSFACSRRPGRPRGQLLARQAGLYGFRERGGVHLRRRDHPRRCPRRAYPMASVRPREHEQWSYVRRGRRALLSAPIRGAPARDHGHSAH
mmetsp:Transcript_54957/g.125105  ORF Transcript_54957/g.125105 Transcript_54957/m.125105 type:complete len:287 (+) Transcript_54957:138-998(+)